ncbi:MAG: hypothetical protein CBC06_000100 [bacterium TMED46]|nr:MAG: hypothetical protein CBC06_000100 [bacterium TMED46]|tara:strand:+ start:2779 stop:3327 length:549 start_codon:yes stop_codon:yes gene_type:complete
MSNIKPSINLFGKEYYNDDQISELAYKQMEKNGRWKIILTENTLSGHTLHNNGNIIKLNFNGIYILLKKNGLAETSLYTGSSTKSSNDIDNRIGKFIKHNRGIPITQNSGTQHRDDHAAAIWLRKNGICNVENDDVYVMWVSDDFIYNLGQNIILKKIENKLIVKKRSISNKENRKHWISYA